MPPSDPLAGGWAAAGSTQSARTAAASSRPANCLIPDVALAVRFCSSLAYSGPSNRRGAPVKALPKRASHGREHARETIVRCLSFGQRPPLTQPPRAHSWIRSGPRFPPLPPEAIERGESAKTGAGILNSWPSRSETEGATISASGRCKHPGACPYRDTERVRTRHFPDPWLSVSQITRSASPTRRKRASIALP